ncbi:MAG TPA: hypothetical protein VJ810_13760 [Blastocatellia bacterium]|nr:hypothetical protein [Blastocatellia bacterium]
MAFGPNELRNYAYLNALLDSFQTRVANNFRKLALDYCVNGTTPEVRFERVKEMRKALSGVGPLPKEITVVANPYPTCPTGQHCEGGACVPDDVYTGWPGEGDPTAWNQ